jgi:hypothetical protein
LAEFSGIAGFFGTCAGRKNAERYEAKIREIRDQQAARRWRHQHYIAALSQRMSEINQELQALTQGKEIVRDPTTYN